MSNFSNEIAALQPGEVLIIRKRRADSWGDGDSGGGSSFWIGLLLVGFFAFMFLKSTPAPETQNTTAATSMAAKVKNN